MSYTQEMQLISYYANDIAEQVMSYTHDIRYDENHVHGCFCGLSVMFTHDYVSRISCADFELVFDRKFAHAANDKTNDTSNSTYPIFTNARFVRGNEEDLRRWRLKLYQFKSIAA